MKNNIEKLLIENIGAEEMAPPGECLRSMHKDRSSNPWSLKREDNIEKYILGHLIYSSHREYSSHTSHMDWSSHLGCLDH